MHHKKPPYPSDKKSNVEGLAYTDVSNNDRHDDQSQSFVMQDTAANDLFISNFDLDLNFDPPETQQSGWIVNNAEKLRRLVVILLLTLIAISAAYYYTKRPKNPPISDVNIIKPIEKITASSSVAADLEELGNDIILARRWRSPDLNEFGKLWDQLDQKSQKLVLQSIWFQHFSFNLKRQAGGLFGVESENEASKMLANKLGLELSSVKISHRIDDKESRPEQKIAMVDTGAKSSIDSSDIKKSADNSKKQDSFVATDIASTQATFVLEKITDSEIKQVLNQYSKSYIFGNTADFDDLFVKFDDAQQQSAISELKQEFAILLKGSQQRWVEFQDLAWELDNEVAIGTGRIKLESTLQNNSRKTTSANILIKLRRDNNQVKIAGFNLSNQTISIKEFVATKMQESTNTIGASSTQPSLIEVQGVVTRYIEAYEKGNIEMLDRLFTEDVISNKGTTKAEIRKEYVDIFAASGNRQMTIQDLHWKLAKQRAKGVGAMKVVLEKDNEVKVINSKIQFVTQKVNNEVLITHLYQLESAE